MADQTTTSTFGLIPTEKEAEDLFGDLGLPCPQDTIFARRSTIMASHLK